LAQIIEKRRRDAPQSREEREERKMREKKRVITNRHEQETRMDTNKSEEKRFRQN